MRALCFSVLLLAVGCLPPGDEPSNIRDLRILGANFEPPELMAPICNIDNPQAAFLSFARPIKMTWLIQDAFGADRTFQYELKVCANQGDRTCENAGDFRVLQSGATKAGELTFTTVLAAVFLDDAPLLQETIEQDRFRGLGGIRVPVVLHLKVDDEEIYAQKLMVFSCGFFPTMKQNVTPRLPGMKVDGVEWKESDKPTLEGKGPFKVEPLDFSALQEDYVVPSFELKPVQLKEAWKVHFYGNAGRFSPADLGGVDFSGEAERYETEWQPRSTDKEDRDVDFYFVVRDGRGGQSWLKRTARMVPPKPQ